MFRNPTLTDPIISCGNTLLLNDRHERHVDQFAKLILTIQAFSDKTIYHNIGYLHLVLRMWGEGNIFIYVSYSGIIVCKQYIDSYDEVFF